MSSELSLQITDGPKAGVKIVVLNGELDENTLEPLKEQMAPVLNDETSKFLVFNLADLAFINSKGIGFFVFLHTHLAKAQRKLILVAAQEAVTDVMSLVGLTSVIPYFATVNEAVTGL
ncbi:STAS domain-containing protein [Candidatus Peregrinibacteria bacterium]|nr:STAS domain-containing protein [Candidatus Peregrinibacteria bacterium]